MTNEEMTNEEIVLRLYQEVVTGGNKTVANQLVAPNCPLRSNNVSHGRGPDSFVSVFSELRDASPDVQWIVEEQVPSEDDKVWTRYTVSGTHEHEFMGVAPTGKPLEFTGVSVCRIDKSQIVQWDNWDSLLEANDALAGKHDTDVIAARAKKEVDVIAAQGRKDRILTDLQRLREERLAFVQGLREERLTAVQGLREKDLISQQKDREKKVIQAQLENPPVWLGWLTVLLLSGFLVFAGIQTNNTTNLTLGWAVPVTALVAAAAVVGAGSFALRKRRINNEVNTSELPSTPPFVYAQPGGAGTTPSPSTTQPVGGDTPPASKEEPAQVKEQPEGQTEEPKNKLRKTPPHRHKHQRKSLRARLRNRTKLRPPILRKNPRRNPQ